MHQTHARRYVPLDTVLALPGLLVGDTLLEKVVERRPEADKVVAGHREAARRADLVDVDEDDGPRAGDDGHLLLGDDFVEGRRAVFEDVA